MLRLNGLTCHSLSEGFPLSSLTQSPTQGVHRWPFSLTGQIQQ